MAFTEHWDQWRQVDADRARLPSAVEEILRWASANRDEDVFADPFRFDVQRDPNPHLAFGHGSHFCLGANVARMEIRLVLEALLDRVDHAELAGPPEWTRSNEHTGLRHLPVKLTPR